MFDYAEDDSLWKEDLFAILGIPEDADEKATKDAYKKLAKQYHPDRFPAGTEAQREAKDVFSKITKAYDVLTNAIKRQNYLDTRRLLADHINKGSEAAPKAEKQSTGLDEMKRKQAEELFAQAEKHVKKAELDTAIDYYKQAIEIVPNVGKYHSRLGKTYQDKGWSGMAQASFKMALSLNPRDSIAQEGYKPELVKKAAKAAGKKSFLDGLLARFKKK